VTSDRPRNERLYRRGWFHRLVLAALVIAAVFGALLIGGIAAIGSSNYAEGQCQEARWELQPQGGGTIISRAAFPPRIVCEFSDGQQVSRLDWMNILGLPAFAVYVVFWVVVYRRVDRRLREVSLSRQ
jgi:hypothetical protein